MPKTKTHTEKPYLFVDLSNLVYKNTASLHFLKTPSGLMTGGVFGTLRNLISWSNKFRVWVFADGYGTQRRDLIKGYKVGRKDSIIPSAAKPVALRGMTKEFLHVDDYAHWEDPSAHTGDLLEEEVCQEFNPEHVSLKKTSYAHMDTLVKCLTDFGFPLVYHKDFEADDMIGAAVYLKERLGSQTLPEIYIVSTDKDFDQLPAHRLSPMKAHLKYATGKSPISGYALLGATTLANFPEIPEDSILRSQPFALSLYRSVVGDVSDKIKGIMTTLRAWKKDPEGNYNVEKIIKVMLDTLGNPVDYLSYTWALDQAFLDPAAFQVKLGDRVPEAVVTNLHVIKLPIDLVRTAAEPIVRAYQGDGYIEGPLADFWLPGKMPPEFKGWEVNHSEVAKICDLYLMPSLDKKLLEVSLLTTHLV